VNHKPTTKEITMSLAIQVDNVAAVLLPDGWHDVADNSFNIDSYEYVHGDLTVHGGGWGGVCSSGYSFTEPDGTAFAGPLTAIVGVRGPGLDKAAPRVELPKWCGECDGPELEARWVSVPNGSVHGASKRCPRCNPHAKKS
jgi:hypothetical protein